MLASVVSLELTMRSERKKQKEAVGAGEEVNNSDNRGEKMQRKSERKYRRRGVGADEEAVWHKRCKWIWFSLLEVLFPPSETHMQVVARVRDAKNLPRLQCAPCCINSVPSPQARINVPCPPELKCAVSVATDAMQQR